VVIVLLEGDSKLCFCDTKTLGQGLKRSPRHPACGAPR
jgi:hypothetical protein